MTPDAARPLDVAIVCALACEAQPVLRALGLDPIGNRGLRRDHGVGLLVSGVGVARAAAGVETLAEHADASTCWLNFGCAGGRGPVGELVVAHKVSDEGGEAWYPQFSFPVRQRTVEVRTVTRPETRYPEGVLYEMEGAGFYRAALRRASLERVQVLKVRVDGPGHPAERLTADLIEAQAGRCVDEVLGWVESLRQVARSMRSRRPDRGQVDAFLERWHFTVSERVQLERALARLYARSLPAPSPSGISAADATRVLTHLAEVVAGSVGPPLAPYRATRRRRQRPTEHVAQRPAPLPRKPPRGEADSA